MQATHAIRARCLWLILLLCWQWPAWADVPASLPSLDADLLRALRGGGYTLFIRHGPTDTSRPDRQPHVDLNDCATQRALNDEGRKMAAEIGKALASLRIPLGDIVSSPYCRTRESAQLAFGRFATDARLMSSSNVSGEGFKALQREFRAILAMPVAAGANRVLVGHSALLMDTTGLFLKPEGATLVLRSSDAGDIVPIALIPASDWFNWSRRAGQ